jgi:hypothetical protein
MIVYGAGESFRSLKKRMHTPLAGLCLLIQMLPRHLYIEI